MIYVTGDTHGYLDFDKLSPTNFILGNSLTKNDYLIILGDVGVFRFNQEFLKEFEQKPYTTLMIEGNHEDYSFIKSLPSVEMFNGYVKKVNESLFILQRGQIYTIENKTFFTFGGAKSVDRYRRTEGVDWFPEEETNYAEITYALDYLVMHKNKVDYILTHDCSQSALEYLAKIYRFYPEITSHNKFFEEIKNIIDFKMWYFGHHHKDIVIKGDKERCLYNEIVELETGNIVN
jgi:DNA repair exonuclease SbcCD nuclease subunit